MPFPTPLLAPVTTARRSDAMPHAQALCDQMGQALERAQTLRQAAAALQEANIAKFVAGEPKKVIYVPGRLLNIVV